MYQIDIFLERKEKCYQESQRFHYNISQYFRIPATLLRIQLPNIYHFIIYYSENTGFDRQSFFYISLPRAVSYLFTYSLDSCTRYAQEWHMLYVPRSWATLPRSGHDPRSLAVIPAVPLRPSCWRTASSSSVISIVIVGCKQ